MLLLLPLISVSENDTIKSRKYTGYFDSSVGISYFYLRDNATSPLIYKGLNFSSDLRIMFLNNKMRHGAILGFNYGKLKPVSIYNSSRIENIGTGIDYFYLRKFSEINDKNITLFAGLSINIGGNIRDHSRYVNNSISYEQVNSLNINFQSEYNFTLFKRDFQLIYRTYSPFYAFVLRPSFASSVPEGFIDQTGNNFKAYLESCNHLTFNKYFRWNNSFDLCYILKNGNKLRLSYGWDFYNIDILHNVKSANHKLLFSTMFNF